jgi:hypothetical protein
MLPVFCLRLACGLAGSLILLLSLRAHPRFYRVHFWTVVGLTAGSAFWLRDQSGPALWVALGCAAAFAFLGSVVWFLEGLPGEWACVLLTTAALAAALGLLDARAPEPQGALPAEHVEAAWGWRFADDLTSAAVLGVAMTAMLLGHSYLIAPSMSMTPLRRLLAALFVVLAVRAALAGVGLWHWTRAHSPGNVEDVTIFWLPVRWGVGFVAPFVLAWMARETAKIRSTQSATGILYVVVIFCFLGELTSQLLLRSTGLIL